MKKPKTEHTVTLYFDTKVGVKNFVALYAQCMEQTAGYYQKSGGRDWLYLQPDPNSCPRCEFSEMQESYDEDDLETLICNNCSFGY